MQCHHPHVLSLARDEQLRRLERRPQLVRDALEQADLLRGPGPRRADLIEREDARKLSAETDRRRDRGERAAFDERVASEARIRQPGVGPRVAHGDGAALADRERGER